MICRLLLNLGQVHFLMDFSSGTDSHCISYVSEARELLVQRRDAGMDESDMWQDLMRCDQNVCKFYLDRGQLEKAKYLSVECVAAARQYNGPNQAEHLITALTVLSICVRGQCDFPEALALAEEAYLIASKHYSPAHRRVLEAAGPLIDCLFAMKDYSTADTYCRMNYSNVIDPNNAQEYYLGEAINVMRQLVQIWICKEPDEDEIVEKALGGEAIDLSRKVYAFALENRSIFYRISHLSILCQVLLKRNELTEETEGLLHQLATICIAENNFDGEYKRDSFMYLYTFYSKIHESFRIGKKTTLVQENIELCNKMLLELESCNNGSVNYVKKSQVVKPYFKNNVELHI